MGADDDKVINLKDASDPWKQKKNMSDTSQKQPNKQPMINLPPATKILVFTMIAVYFVQEVSMTVTGKVSFFYTFGFVPTYFSEFNGSQLISLISPLTYMFIHGTLVHIMINSLMLLAFGGGLEKWLGTRKFLLLFFGSGLIAVLTHFVFDMWSGNVVIGASGATSGLFAAGLIMLRNMGTGIGSGPYGLYPLIALYVAISVVFGVTGSPDGSSIAWIAHIGGFAAGFLFMKLFRKI